jgi:hypothetical protein
MDSECHLTGHLMRDALDLRDEDNWIPFLTIGLYAPRLAAGNRSSGIQFCCLPKPAPAKAGACTYEACTCVGRWQAQGAGSCPAREGEAENPILYRVTKAELY